VLPVGWHTTPIRQLRAGAPAATAPRTRRRRRTLDTGVALRATAIVLVVGTHAELFTVRGGAHLLLALAGFHFARFQLTDAPRWRRIRHMGVSLARIAVPSALFLAFLAVLDDRYSWQNALLLNEAFGPRVGPQRHYWFVETLVYLLAALAALLAIRRVDRWERRLPFVLPAALLAAGLTVRYDLIPLSPWDNFSTPARLFWFFALGWAAAKANGRWQRLLVTAAGLVAVADYFGNPLREAVIAGGLVLLIWVPRLPSLAAVNRLAGLLAGSSLYIYLTHWQIYPHLQRFSPLLATLASLLAGAVFGLVVGRATRRLGRLRTTLRARRRTPADAFGQGQFALAD
jgi:peptidoglycan/LPS O-acetylase OafA/YrhL